MCPLAGLIPSGSTDNPPGLKGSACSCVPRRIGSGLPGGATEQQRLTLAVDSGTRFDAAADNGSISTVDAKRAKAFKFGFRYTHFFYALEPEPPLSPRERK